MIKIENLVHKYTIWKDENTKSEKTEYWTEYH